MKGKKEQVEQEDSSSSESSCSEDESKAEGKVKAKKESKKVNIQYLLLIYCWVFFCKLLLLPCVFMKIYLCAQCPVHARSFMPVF